MPNSDRMGWPYPSENQKPWYELFQDFVTAQDASGFAARDDRNIVIAEGGTITWDSGTSTLTWGSDIKVISPISARVVTVSAGTATLDDGDSLYIDMPRLPASDQTVAGQIAAQLPSSDTALVLCLRVGTSLYWRNGLTIADGTTATDLTPTQNTNIVWKWNKTDTSQFSAVQHFGSNQASSATLDTYFPVGGSLYRALRLNVTGLGSDSGVFFPIANLSPLDRYKVTIEYNWPGSNLDLHFMVGQATSDGSEGAAAYIDEANGNRGLWAFGTSGESSFVTSLTSIGTLSEWVFSYIPNGLGSRIISLIGSEGTPSDGVVGGQQAPLFGVFDYSQMGIGIVTGSDGTYPITSNISISSLVIEKVVMNE